MTNPITATTPAGQLSVPPSAQPAPPHASNRWDWLRIGIFFWGMVFLITLVPTALYAWYYGTLLSNRYLYSLQAQINLTFSVVDLVLPEALLIGGSTLLDRTYWRTDGPSRRWAIRRLTLALGIVGGIACFALAFNGRIYQAFQLPSAGYDFEAQLRGLAAGWLLVGVENSLALGVALAFVFRRLSQRTGRAWRVGLFGAALTAGSVLGISNHLDTLLIWAATVWMAYVRTVSVPGPCIGASGAGCFTGEALTWVVAGALPLLLALPLGALVGAPLAYPYDAGEARHSHPSAAAERDAGAQAQPQNAERRHPFWRALGRGTGSFVAGLLVTAGWIYALLQLFSATGRTTGATMLLLVAIQLLPIGTAGFIGAIRVARLPRERRPSTRSIVALAVVVVLGVVPIILPGAFLFPIGSPRAPNTLSFAGMGFSFTISLGALLALCWWQATSANIRRVLTTALACWLGFALPLLLVTGSVLYWIRPLSVCNAHPEPDDLP